MTLGVSRILRERKHQLRQYDREHDETEHSNGELANAACYLASTDKKKTCPIGTPSWVYRLKIKHEDDRLRQLEIAGALIAAEIERLIGKL